MIEVEIWSDFVCPFCYIGKKHFEKALEKYPQKDQVRVTYKSFELDPDAPTSQVKSIYEVLAEKYGKSIEWAKEANQQVTQMASDVGLKFNMDTVIPTNSFDAHQLSYLAKEKGIQDKVSDRLFSAYFCEGKDLASPEVLEQIGLESGLAKADLDKVIKTSSYTRDVRSDEAEGADLGVRGVPFFVFNRKIAVSGAQPEDVFIQALNEAL